MKYIFSDVKPAIWKEYLGVKEGRMGERRFSCEKSSRKDRKELFVIGVVQRIIWLIHQNCKARNEECFRCKKIGHFAAMCRGAPKKHDNTRINDG